MAAGGALPVTSGLLYANEGGDPYRLDGVTAGTRTVSSYTWDEPEPPGARTVSSYTWDEGGAGYGDRSALPTFQRGEPSAQHAGDAEWIAPAATGPAGAAIAVATFEAQAERDQPPEVIETPPSAAVAKAPVDPEPLAAAMQPPRMWEGVVLPKADPPDVIDEGAPKIMRHETDVSVSQLHVPGEFPKRQ